MFSFAPKQVEPTIVPKKGRKNKEIALEHFEKSMDKIEVSVSSMETIIKLWKELNVGYLNFNFYCGGDSMGDTIITIYDKNDVEIESSELDSYFDTEIYNRVGFYVNSDGHYQGENGDVRIELNEEEDDFYYNKIAQSEWNESIASETTIALNEKEIKFIKDNISNINGGENNCVINFKRDFILTNDEEELVTDLETKLNDFTCQFSPTNFDGDLQDWHTFTTNDDGDELTITDDGLRLFIDNSVTIYRDSDE